MAQAKWRQQDGVIDWQQNAEVQHRLDRGNIYRTIALRLQGQLTLTSANNTAAALHRADEWGLLNSIQLVENNGRVIHNFTPAQLIMWNYYLFGRTPDAQTELADTSQANPSFDSVLLMPLMNPLAAKPFEFAYPTRRKQALTLKANWLTGSNVNTNVSGFETDPTIEVYTYESQGVPGSFTFHDGRFRRLSTTFGSAFTDLQIDRYPTDEVYGAFLFEFTDAGADPISSESDILNQLTIKTPSNVMYDYPKTVVEMWDKLWEGRPIFQSRRSGNHSLEGFYFVNFLTDGLITEGIDASQINNLISEFDVSNPDTTQGINASYFTYTPGGQGGE